MKRPLLSALVAGAALVGGLAVGIPSASGWTRCGTPQAESDCPTTTTTMPVTTTTVPVTTTTTPPAPPLAPPVAPPPVVSQPHFTG